MYFVCLASLRVIFGQEIDPCCFIWLWVIYFHFLLCPIVWICYCLSVLLEIYSELFLFLDQYDHCYYEQLRAGFLMNICIHFWQDKYLGVKLLSHAASCSRYCQSGSINYISTVYVRPSCSAFLPIALLLSLFSFSYSGKWVWLNSPDDMKMSTLKVAHYSFCFLSIVR